MGVDCAWCTDEGQCDLHAMTNRLSRDMDELIIRAVLGEPKPTKPIPIDEED